MPDIVFEQREGAIGVITFNRPEKRNAFTTDMRNELTELLRSEEVDALDALVLRGEGTVFSAGADLKEVGKRDSWPARAAAGALLNAFHRCGPVIVAAVQGPALGLGSGIAMACDLVIAGESASFGYPEVQHGLVAGVTMVGLRNLVAQRAAFELVVTGRRVPAAEALALGMVNRIVPDAEVDDTAMELARSISANSRAAVRTTKRFFYEIDDLTRSAALQSGERVIELARRTAVEERTAKDES